MFEAFLEIARQLNLLGITPLLMGSLGFEVRTSKDWQAGDIDIHVPGDSRGWEAPDEERLYHWKEIAEMMENLGYRLVDIHEHEFQRGHLSVEYGVMDTLPEFAGIPLISLEKIHTDGVVYYLPTLEQYLKIYQASSKDSYRANRNNRKDFKKISYLQKYLKADRRKCVDI
ncbi:phosphoribosylanthranilate isomerase [Streptococcus sp. NLN64]|uniref:phosphoribosylanthranilate isomerase n=1 Tax=Streptococcus sp. NLN64 TaxID=2822799 RepID=UPI0018C99276|nr:phosphoribosylanthranilate isomerase [Streptococcus sp. NLN64]MBG9367088.1 phosphoribosylanthranilate isomerase [Streptococcus sp. NLN64]